MKTITIEALNDDPNLIDQKITSQLNATGTTVLRGRYMRQKEQDKVSFRCSPVSGLLEIIDHAADKSRRDRSDWIRQSLYIVALAELAGVDVHELLRRYVK